MTGLPAHRPPAAGRPGAVLLDDGWTFGFDADADADADAEPVPVVLPHTFNDTDGAAPSYRRSVGRYRRLLRVAPRPGTRQVLYLEGVNQVAVVSVDGREVGRHEGGYTAFAVDITEAVRAQDVTLDITADNRHCPDIPPLSADFTFYGGVYRHVWLLTVPDLHLAFVDGGPGVRIDTVAGDHGTTVTVTASVHNGGASSYRARVHVAIDDPDGAGVADAGATIDVAAGAEHDVCLVVDLPDARRWRPDDPARYLACVTVESDAADTKDSVEVPFGIRTLALVDGRVAIDGRALDLLGTARHQDVVGRGNALDDDDHRRDVALLAETGARVLRLAHYPQADAVLDAADRLGLLLWEEIPVVNAITPGERFAQNSLRMQREMIAQHRHHPSIALWGYMNEVLIARPDDAGPDYDDAVVGLAGRLEAQSRTLDPGRLTAMACHRLGGGDDYDRIGLTEQPMIVGWNVYAGWYEGVFDDLGTFLDEQHVARPDRALWLSEFGADCLPSRHSAAPERPDASMEWAQLYHESYLRQVRRRPWLAGATSWVGFDFAVAGRGAPAPGVNTKGLFTSAREPKDTAWLYRANLTTAPVLHLCGRDWTDRPAGVQTLVVYTNLPEVTIEIDGRSPGPFRPDDIGVIRWPVDLAPGSVTVAVRAVDDSGRMHERHAVFEVSADGGRPREER